MICTWCNCPEDCLFRRLLSIHTPLKMNGWKLKITAFAKENHLPTNQTSMTLGSKLHSPRCSRKHSVGKHSIHIHNYRGGGDHNLNEFRNKQAIFAVFFLVVLVDQEQKIANFFLAKSGEIRKDILESTNVHFRERCRVYRLESFLFKQHCQPD